MAMRLIQELEAFQAKRVADATLPGQRPAHLERSVLSIVSGQAPGEPELEEGPNVSDARLGYETRIRAVFDSMVHGELARLRSLGEDRGAEIESWLSQNLDESFELFWGILDSACRLPDVVDPKKPLEYLDFMEELTLGFIRAFQKHPQKEAVYERIVQLSKQKPEKPMDRVFLGAAIPDAFPHFDHFAEACRKVPDARPLFPAFNLELQRLTSEATHGRQKAYPVASSRLGWVTLFPVLKEFYPGLRVHTTTHEYLSMILTKDDFDVVEGKSEEELIQSFRMALDTDRSEEKPSMIFIASVRRTGERVDVDYIMTTLKAEFPDTLFVIDGAQDHLVHSRADAVFFSKRFGATGTGILMLSSDLDPLIHERCEVRQGVQLADVAKTLASFRCERKPLHFASPLSDLQDTPTLWNFVGGGNYIEYESDKVRQRVQEDPILNKHFTAMYSPEERNEDNPNIWRSARTIALHLKPESQLSLSALARAMAEAPYGFQIDWISTASLPEFQALSEMSNAPFSPEHCGAFFQEILRFQNRSRPTYLTEMLALPEVFNGTAVCDEATYEKQRQHLLASSKRQNLIRFHIDISKSHDAIHRCLDALSTVTSSLAPAL